MVAESLVFSQVPNLVEIFLGSFARQVGKSTAEFFGELNPDLTVVLDPGETGYDLTTTAEHQASIARFLGLPSVRTLVSVASLRVMLIESQGNGIEGMTEEELSSQFTALAARWCEIESLHWDDYADRVWEAAIAPARGLATQVGGLQRGPRFEALLEHVFFSSTKTSVPPRYITALGALAGDPELLRRLAGIVDRLRSASSGRLNGTFVVHGAEENIAFEDLYVVRSLNEVATGAIISSEDFVQPDASWHRAVVVGDPGVGKSSFMSWLEWSATEASRLERPPAPAVVLPASLYLAQRGKSLSGQIAVVLAGRYGESVDDAELEALLACGAFTLVVDAVDEIKDVVWREEVIAQVGVLARNFPATRIVCSTRKTGDEAANFQRHGFHLYEIAEYTEEQSSEYVNRWFSLQGRDRSVARKFAGETRHLRDLVANPLMLSLLCFVYARTSYIPQSRWHVYERCAYLMFLEWETKRELDVPTVHKERGESAIRALTHHMRTAGGYTAAIPESVARGIISNVLKEGGASRFEAERDASVILRHCTERAWVFSEREGDSPERHFGFTHRTFYEFYLADAIVQDIFGRALRGVLRADNMMVELRDAIVREHRNDPSSVLPELLVQAADNRAEGQAGEQILSQLVLGSETAYERARAAAIASYGAGTAVAQRELAKIRPGKADYSTGLSRVSLASRLLSGARAGQTQAERVFQRTVALWAVGDEREDDLGELSFSVESMEAFRCLLDVPSGHRELFEARVRADRDAARGFLRRYSVIAARGESDLYESAWSRLAAELEPAGSARPTSVWYDVVRGATQPWAAIGARLESSHLTLVVHEGQSPRTHSRGASDVTRAGVLWHAIARSGGLLGSDEIRLLRNFTRRLGLAHAAGDDYVDGYDFLVPSEAISVVKGNVGGLPPAFLVAICVASASPSAAALAQAHGAKTHELYSLLLDVRHDVRTSGGDPVVLADLRRRANLAYRSTFSSSLPQSVARVVQLE